MLIEIFILNNLSIFVKSNHIKRTLQSTSDKTTNNELIDHEEQEKLLLESNIATTKIVNKTGHDQKTSCVINKMESQTDQSQNYKGHKCINKRALLIGAFVFLVFIFFIIWIVCRFFDVGNF
ncbi:hypothetical protein CDIK_3717 [Cucumispora dikerogammari]|nr:hypothetical protein CDIK_3717 [Cucumispora dikerogammari]